MPKCLRCGADGSFIQGKVPDEPIEAAALVEEAQGDCEQAQQDRDTAYTLRDEMIDVLEAVALCLENDGRVHWCCREKIKAAVRGCRPAPDHHWDATHQLASEDYRWTCSVCERTHDGPDRPPPGECRTEATDE